jgi:hypothetical protein
LMALFEYDAFRGLFVSVWLKFGQWLFLWQIHNQFVEMVHNASKWPQAIWRAPPSLRGREDPDESGACSFQLSAFFPLSFPPS